VDFLRDKDGIPGIVERLEYDPTALRTWRWFFIRTASAATSWRPRA